MGKENSVLSLLPQKNQRGLGSSPQKGDVITLVAEGQGIDEIEAVQKAIKPNINDLSNAVTATIKGQVAAIPKVNHDEMIDKISRQLPTRQITDGIDKGAYTKVKSSEITKAEKAPVSFIGWLLGSRKPQSVTTTTLNREEKKIGAKHLRANNPTFNSGAIDIAAAASDSRALATGYGAHAATGKDYATSGTSGQGTAGASTTSVSSSFHHDGISVNLGGIDIAGED